jgi:hypothetical protein
LHISLIADLACAVVKSKGRSDPGPSGDSPMSWRGLAPVLTLLFAAAPQGAQPPAEKPLPTQGKQTAGAKAGKKAPTSRDLLQWLDEPLETAAFRAKMPLKLLLTKFSEALSARGKEAVFFVDVTTFREAQPDAANLLEIEVKLPPVPQRLSFGRLLRLALAELPEGMTFMVRRGRIEITTAERASPGRLLDERVAVSFDKRPLAEALEELADLTGASILLDPRVGEKAQAPVTAVFRNTITLETAVRFLAAMAGLSARLEDDVLFVTAGDAPKRPVKESNRDSTNGSVLRLRDRLFPLALQEVANWSGTRITLDPKAAKAVAEWSFSGLARTVEKYPVSGVFRRGTPVWKIVRQLADQVGLKVVIVNSSLYLTCWHPVEKPRARSLPARVPYLRP